MQPLSSACQPALYRAERPAQPLGGLFVRDPLQAAEDHRQAIGFGEMVDLVVDDRPELVTGNAVGVFHGECLRVGPRSFPGFLPLSSRSQPHRDSPRHAMQPAAQGIVVSHGFGSSRQDEKRGLEGVFGKVRVKEQPAADAQDHRSVPLDECGKRGFRARTFGRKIALQQLRIGQATERTSLEQRANLLADARLDMPS